MLSNGQVAPFHFPPLTLSALLIWRLLGTDVMNLSRFLNLQGAEANLTNQSSKKLRISQSPEHCKGHGGPRKGARLGDHMVKGSF